VGSWLLMVRVRHGAARHLVIDQGRMITASVLEALLSSIRPTYTADQSAGFKRHPVSGDGRPRRLPRAQGLARCCWACWSGSQPRSGFGRCSLREENMTLRIVCAFVCHHLSDRMQSGAAIPIAPRRLPQQRRDWACSAGMNLPRAPRTERSDHHASRIDPFWFTSVRDTVALH